MWSLTFKDIHTTDICSWEYAIGFGGVFLNLTIYFLCFKINMTIDWNSVIKNHSDL